MGLDAVDRAPWSAVLGARKAGKQLVPSLGVFVVGGVGGLVHQGLDRLGGVLRYSFLVVHLGRGQVGLQPAEV